MALRHRRYWLLIGWGLIALVVYLSLTAHPPKLFALRWADKLAHFTEYLLLMGWFVQIYRSTRQRLFWAALFIAQGLALEIMQGMSRWRSFDYWDATANMVGVMVAWWLASRGLDRLLPALERRLLGRAPPEV